MKTRNELAHDYLCAMNATEWGHRVTPSSLVSFALAQADEFLAAVGEQGEKGDPSVRCGECDAEPSWSLCAGVLNVTPCGCSKQREPDAVWELDDDGVTYVAEPGVFWMDDVIRLLAGRERVKLRVYVEEEGK